MANDPIAVKCPFCRWADVSPGHASGALILDFVCGTSRHWWTNELSDWEQSDTCRLISQALATLTADRDHFRQRYVELYSTVWGEQYADFEDSDKKHAEAIEEVERANQALLENSRLRVMAGLLEQCDKLKLPNGRQIYRTYDGTWHHKIIGTAPVHPTARAAIYAAMGWEERSGE